MSSAQYEAQLEQTNAALELDPENSELLALKRDLEELIDLSQNLAPKKLKTVPKHDRPEAPASSISTSSTEAVATDTKSQTAALSPSIPINSERPKENDVSTLKIGDKCQIRSEGGGWLDATISSINSNRSRWIAITIKTNETKAVSSRDIRPIPEHRSAPALQLMSLADKKQTVSSQKEKERRIKKAAARKEYIAQKEAEHEEKTKAWSSFRTKIAKKASPSLFKGHITGKSSLN